MLRVLFSHRCYLEYRSLDVTRKAKLVLISIFGFLTLFAYFGVKTLVASEYDFLSPVDESIPFIPDFIWIYHMLVPMIVVTLYRTEDKKEFFVAFWSLCFASFFANLCYYAIPSFYPYPVFVPETWAEHLTLLTHQIDGSSNTFPSSHVAFSFVLSLSQLHSRSATQIKKALYSSFAVLTAIATLVLKQHYIIDVLGGVTLALLSFYASKYLMERDDKHANTETTKLCYRQSA